MEGPQARCVELYIDDITVYISSLEKHVIDLERVFQRLKNASLRVSVSKTNMARYSNLLLGNRVSRDGIKSNHDIMIAIVKLSMPQNICRSKGLWG